MLFMHHPYCLTCTCTTPSWLYGLFFTTQSLLHNVLLPPFSLRLWLACLFYYAQRQFLYVLTPIEVRFTFSSCRKQISVFHVGITVIISSMIVLMSEWRPSTRRGDVTTLAQRTYVPKLILFFTIISMST